ncbi:MAG: toll/interleukin-1 receptor domain-containing protein, partial [Rubrivivax sp.]|nr:toll/interleukin-1 receptor domain-containing protein [Rubrivivax sp.]
DEAKKNTLNKHLTVLTRAGVALDVWDDRRIQGGDDWRQEIRQAIEGCDIALLLISADFLISKFILDEEVPRLLERRVQAQVRVIPIILGPCQWQLVPWLAPLQARPTDGKPLSKLGKAKVDEMLSSLAGEIHRLHTQASAPKPASVVPAAQPVALPLTDGPVVVEPLPPAPSDRYRGPASTLYGRRALQARMAEGMATHDVLALYGFRGNGKSVLIEQVQRTPPAHLPAQWVRVNAASEQNAATLFARVADALGDRNDRPLSPPRHGGRDC